MDGEAAMPLRMGKTKDFDDYRSRNEVNIVKSADLTLRICNIFQQCEEATGVVR
jgi:hypothetical protein